MGKWQIIQAAHCKECGLTYGAGYAPDERYHRKFHDSDSGAIRVTAVTVARQRALACEAFYTERHIIKRMTLRQLRAFADLSDARIRELDAQYAKGELQATYAKVEGFT
jgi:zinc-finger of acetyl-transferase ESCO